MLEIKHLNMINAKTNPTSYGPDSEDMKHARKVAVSNKAAMTLILLARNRVNQRPK